MTRGVYIVMAVFGLLLTVAAALSAVVSVAPPGYAQTMAVGQLVAATVGVALTVFGLVQARTASEYDVRLYGRRRGRRADASVAAAEVAFDCPECGRAYRAAGQMAGKPFACRRCDARFTVPRPTAG